MVRTPAFQAVNPGPIPGGVIRNEAIRESLKSFSAPVVNSPLQSLDPKYIIESMNEPTVGLDPQLTDAVIGTLREPIIILDKNLHVIVASRAFYDTFNVEYEDVHGKMFYELGNGEWNIPPLRALLEQVVPEKTTVEG